MTETIIDLIRHGEPVGGRAYRGHNIDDPLSDKGWHQMWSAVDQKCPWQAIISSPLSRCLSFARALSEDNKIPLQIIDDFKEVGFGSWEGMTPDQIKQDNLQEYEDFYRDPVNCRPAGAENLDHFYNRVNHAMQDTLSDYLGQHVLVVAHAGVIRAAIAGALQAPPAGMYNIRIMNAGITRIRYNAAANASLEYINSRLSLM